MTTSYCIFSSNLPYYTVFSLRYLVYGGWRVSYCKWTNNPKKLTNLTILWTKNTEAYEETSLLTI
ncbi:hypothetical protein DUE52_14705 [Larkinella punicea]|uniref:Uncharacterized protein n=1 Tax=Larkinella punicea TaxID=2315727 RepID=A0A368JM40_9BACT|nr:hypothetical protein DUE52_14705 [Larkinella punicea]